jgi:hypothetical protein
MGLGKPFLEDLIALKRSGALGTHPVFFIRIVIRTPGHQSLSALLRDD